MSGNRGTGVAASHVAVIGAGGLGCPALLGLAAAGVGTITVVDPDDVEASNLPRQLLYREADVGRPKVEAAAERLRRLHPGVAVRVRQTAFAGDNGAAILDGVDVAVDATDGVGVKLAINDVAIECGVPFCHAGILGLGGQAMLVRPGATPCLRCLFPALAADDEEWASCREAGIVGPVAGLFGALEASLAVLHLAGERGIAGVLISYDRRDDRWRRLDVSAVPRCPRCAAVGHGGERATSGTAR